MEKTLLAKVQSFSQSWRKLGLEQALFTAKEGAFKHSQTVMKASLKQNFTANVSPQNTPFRNVTIVLA